MESFLKTKNNVIFYPNFACALSQAPYVSNSSFWNIGVSEKFANYQWITPGRPEIWFSFYGRETVTITN